MSLSKIGSFLKQTASTIRSLNFESVTTSTSKIHVVTGNEAADADSIISSICFAYYLSESQKDSNKIFIPLMSIPSQDFLLRRETSILIEMAGIHPQDILFAGDINFQSFHSRNLLEMSLTDHNVLHPSLQEYSSLLVQIVDHHQDMGEHPEVTGENRLIAFEENEGGGKATVASCCTQVAELLLSLDGEMEPELATLLLGVIAVDSVNFTQEAGKVTPRDIAAAEALAPYALHSADDLYKILSEAKNDPEFWRGVSVLDCLRYDYKQFTSGSHVFGMSSIPESVETMASKEGFVEAVQQYTADKQIELLAIMSYQKEPQPQRKLFLYSEQEEEIISDLVSHLQNSETFMELEAKMLTDLNIPLSDDFQKRAKFFYQNNIKASRKQVAPALFRFFSSL
eukprot:CAMPEP_0117749502 /NCGR_PEP_ID=MMETSP0947-20121206/9771_1 /TAXON_ID=44440 /ORGANISM="Chattonella subsalsa, Strain CCMP2191" /LENGTH=397 /DNA_ID=CAMNT_0005567411 /DNA_START=160 /DNA_END=1353 /DNA_ORIENTATION=-